MHRLVQMEEHDKQRKEQQEASIGFEYRVEQQCQKDRNDGDPAKKPGQTLYSFERRIQLLDEIFCK